MELKVWVEGIQRIVCGVTENTTCQDVVFALAHATGKSGRFTLIERWRNNERQLAPNENPMKILLKWGEYCNDVQFILQRNDVVAPAPIKPLTGKAKSSPTNQTSPPQLQTSFSETTGTSFNKVNNSFHENVGVVKGIPQQHPAKIHLEVKGVSSTSTSCSPSPHQSPKKSSIQLEAPFYQPHQRIAPPYKDPPAPPPYRDPPPPSSNKNKNILLHQANWVDSKGRPLENGLYNAQYRELIALINYQREKLSNQQVDITKCDAEIGFWESKEREKQLQLDFIAQEMVKINDRTRANKEQIQALVYVEEESEIVKQQEKTLKSEITLLRSKLANCETELLQCKNKMRLLMDQLQAEQKFTNKKTESRKQIERNVLVELERIQSDIESAKRNSELHHLTAETLKKEVAQLETAIIEKKKRVEQLVNEMKEANLQSLTIAPSDEVRHLLEGVTKGPTTRKMIGSPRQLENAVPTSKNPHGVWV